tara:strand:- start:4471 stop:4821 length:351 start_codon:yes stop_codon:yes gene_type:complete
MPIWIKFLLTAALIVAVSEAAKVNDKLGALIGALPLVTTLTMIWLFVEKQGTEKIGTHAFLTFWYVLPTLPMFLLIPWLLQKQFGFWLSLGLGIVLTFLCFGILGLVLQRFKIPLW